MTGCRYNVLHNIIRMLTAYIMIVIHVCYNNLPALAPAHLPVCGHCCAQTGNYPKSPVVNLKLARLLRWYPDLRTRTQIVTASDSECQRFPSVGL